MKKFISISFFIIFTIFFTSCCKRGNTVNTNIGNSVVLDSGKIKDDAKILVLRDTIKLKEDSINHYVNLVRIYKDSVKYYKDSVEYKNYSNSIKILKIKYYIKITKKHPKNKKYFFGWINRTISE